MAQAAAFIVMASLVQTGISYLLPSDGPRMKDLDVAASTYGNAIPRVFGTMRVGGNMIWSLPIEERKKKKRAGKGGSYYNEFTYWGNFAMAFAAGPVTTIRRIWADGKLIYDSTGTATIDAGRFAMRIYTGSEDQLPDPLLEAEDALAGYTPGYRGLCYVVFEDFLLADFGNRIPQMAAEVYVGPNGAPQSADVDLAPANPEDLTNGYQLASFAADFDRGYYYARTASTVQGVAGLRRIRLEDGAQDRFIPLDSMNLPARPGPGFGGNDGVISEIVLRAVTSDGRVIISGPPTNYVPVHMLDAVSYTAIASYGFEGGFEDSGPDPVPYGEIGDTSRNVDGVEHLLLVGQNEDYNVFDVTRASFVELAKGSLPLSGTNVSSMAVGANVARGRPEFFVAQHNNTSTISLHRVSENGVETLTTYSAGAGVNQVRDIYYDAGSNGVLVAVTNTSTTERRLFKYDLDLGAIDWEVRNMPSTALHSPYQGRARIENNEFAFASGSRVYLINTLSGEYIDRDADIYSTLDPNYAPEDPSANDGDQGYEIDDGGSGVLTGDLLPLYDSRRQLLVGWGTGQIRNRHIFVGAFGGGDTSLGSIIQTMFFDAGLTTNDFDVSELFAIPVKGFGFAREVDVKSVLQELKSIYLFDIVESDGKLIGTLRGNTESTQVIDSRLLGSSNPDRSEYWKETRAGEVDLLAQLTLAYMNVDDDYETSSAIAKRMVSPVPTMESKQQAKVEASLAMTPDEAKNRVHAMLYAQWGERVKHNTRWPWALAYLDPADRITVTFPDGRTYFERIHEIETGADLIHDVETVGQDSGAYEFDLTADGGGSGRGQIITPPSPATPFILNTPLLRDVDAQGQDYSVYYGAVGNAGSSAFRGATMFRSLNSTDFDDLFQESDEAEWGSIVGVMPPPPHGVFALDWETRLVITPAVGWFDLESITDDQLWNGLNAALVGNEVIQFRDAEENADGTWTIWNLLRGRRGTEYAAFNHAAGERFLFLDQNTVNIEAESLNAHSQNRWFKAVGSGRSLVETPALQIKYWARDLMPYAPADIRRSIAPGGDITVTWARRTRLGGNLQDGTGSVPLNEGEERYEVYILSAPFSGDLSTPELPENIVRSFEVTTPTVTYTDADQIADSYDRNVDTLHIVVYQLSSAVGRGFPGVRSVAHWDDF